MEENPMAKVLKRAMAMAILHGASYTRLKYNADKDEFDCNVFLPEHIRITYEKERDDKA